MVGKCGAEEEDGKREMKTSGIRRRMRNAMDRGGNDGSRMEAESEPADPAF